MTEIHLLALVFLSAGHILQQQFCGERLEAAFLQYPPAMTNFWPYLGQRQTEAALNKRAYMQSFLPQALRTRPVPIAQQLWGSPDNEKQITIALRLVDYHSGISCM